MMLQCREACSVCATGQVWQHAGMTAADAYVVQCIQCFVMPCYVIVLAVLQQAGLHQQVLSHPADRAHAMQAQVPAEVHEQRLAAPQVYLVSHKDELNFQAPLVVATLRAVLGFSDAAFRRHLKDFFPILTQLISCEHAPLEVQRTLTEVFATRFGPLLQAG